MRSALFLFLILSSVTASTQNLVPNPGFENYTSCPGYFSLTMAEFNAKEWTSAGTGTPDLFNACSEGEADVPYNWAGVSDAYDGKGFAGIYLWMKGENNYREYLQCKLLKCLIKDSLYYIRFRYKLSSYSKYSIDRVGLVLKDALTTTTHDQVISTPSLSIIEDSALTKETGSWQTATICYRATGTERYLVIGNFFSNEQTHAHEILTRPVQQDMLAESAYYYIDGVELRSPYDSLELETIVPYFSGQREVNVTRVLKNVQFEFNSWTLTQSSFPALDSLSDFLKRNPDLRLLVNGHTDDVGTDAYNKMLSLKRAHQVSDYLVRCGIDRKRMHNAGFGKTQPLYVGDSETIRRANRRVEISFTQ